jgi:hypothetical protein
MRYRELTTRKIENIEAQLKNLRFMVSRQQPIEEYFDTIEATEEMLAEIKSLIQQEPLSADEGYGLQ